MAPQSLVGLLAEPRRMRVFAAVVLGASTPTEVVDRTGLTLREVHAALRRLAEAELVTAGAPLAAQLEPLRRAAQTSQTRERAEALDPDRARDSVLRSFVRDGRLVSIQDLAGFRTDLQYQDGRVVRLVDSHGDAHTLTYTPRGFVATVTDPVNRVTTYTYDATGEHVASISDFSGTTRLTHIAGRGPAVEHALESITQALLS